MEIIEKMSAQLEQEGFRVQLTHTKPVTCWLWKGDRIVAVGVDSTPLMALARVRGQVDREELL